MTISDFCISSTTPIPPIIADRILEHHLIPLERVDNFLPFSIEISYEEKGQPSGWRSYWWEIARGRKGGSQHTFGERKTKILNEKGAIDLTCTSFKKNKDRLLEELLKRTEYLRIAEYDTFFHCDYKDLYNGRRRLFKSGKDSKWNFIKFV